MGNVRLILLAACLVVLCTARRTSILARDDRAGNLTYRTVVEIDLVFPRHNAVYQRTADMPIVFAFQNFSAIRNMSYFFQWRLYDRKRKHIRFGTLNQDAVGPESKETAALEPFLIFNSTGDALLDRNSSRHWILDYDFGFMASCEATDDGALLGEVGPPITLLEGVVAFSVADNGTKPDVAAAGPCAGALGNFDVLGYVNGTESASDCPVLADDASTTITYGTLSKPEDGYLEEDIDPVQPCGVQVNSDMAKRVSELLLRARCDQSGSRSGECANISTAPKTRPWQRFFAAAAWAMASVVFSNVCC